MKSRMFDQNKPIVSLEELHNVQFLYNGKLHNAVTSSDETFKKAVRSASSSEAAKELLKGKHLDDLDRWYILLDTCNLAMYKNNVPINTID